MRTKSVFLRTADNVWICWKLRPTASSHRIARFTVEEMTFTIWTSLSLSSLWTNEYEDWPWLCSNTTESADLTSFSFWTASVRYESAGIWCWQLLLLLSLEQFIPLWRNSFVCNECALLFWAEFRLVDAGIGINDVLALSIPAEFICRCCSVVADCCF